MLDFKEFYNKHFDYFLLFFMALTLGFIVYLSIEDSKDNPKIIEKNGRYTYIKNLDFNFFEEKEFLDKNNVSNDEIYLYSLHLNVNKFNEYKEKCDLNNKGDIIDFKFFNNLVGIQERRYLYVDSKQLLKYNEKEIYSKLKMCLNYVIKDLKDNKEILPEKKKLLETIITKIKYNNTNKGYN